jgi:dihydrofolate reductase
MRVVAIAAMAANRVIGRDGGLPWDIPEDMRFFRDTTKGHIMIMGRKTFDSMGVLPKRKHIVITRDPRFSPPPGVFSVSSPEAALGCAREILKAEPDQWGERVFVIGGGEIYTSMLPMTDEILLTEIHADFEGNAHFPRFGSAEFRETSRTSRTSPLPFDFVTYQRVR